MSVEIVREVQSVTFTVERNGVSIVTQPILVVNGGGSDWDGIVNGGTP